MNLTLTNAYTENKYYTKKVWESWVQREQFIKFK